MVRWLRNQQTYRAWGHHLIGQILTPSILHLIETVHVGAVPADGACWGQQGAHLHAIPSGNLAFFAMNMTTQLIKNAEQTWPRFFLLYVLHVKKKHLKQHKQLENIGQRR